MAELTLIQSIMDGDISKITTLVSDIKAAIISRMDTVDYISKTTKHQVVDKIKSVKEIVFPSPDDVFLDLLEFDEVKISQKYFE